MSNFVTLTKDNFKKTIEENEFVIVDFWAPWCDPCVKFTPTFEAAAKKNKDIIFGMVDIEKDKEIAEYFQIKVIPWIISYSTNVPVYLRMMMVKFQQKLLMRLLLGLENMICLQLRIITRGRTLDRLVKF